MIDSITGEKIERMEVYISTMVDVSECQTSSEAYRLSEQITEKIINILDKEGITVYDTYEVFRGKDDDIVDDIDEE